MPNQRRQGAKSVSFWLDAADRQFLRVIAAKAGMSMSDYVKMKLREDLTNARAEEGGTGGGKKR